uniref:Transmembrane protein 254 n=1 Tax=Accipiter nisus TaxID=211598 RepID=A0A8B9MGV4_9AVES
RRHRPPPGGEGRGGEGAAREGARGSGERRGARSAGAGALPWSRRCVADRPVSNRPPSYGCCSSSAPRAHWRGYFARGRAEKPAPGCATFHGRVSGAAPLALLLPGQREGRPPDRRPALRRAGRLPRRGEAAAGRLGPGGDGARLPPLTAAVPGRTPPPQPAAAVSVTGSPAPCRRRHRPLEVPSAARPNYRLPRAGLALSLTRPSRHFCPGPAPPRPSARDRQTDSRPARPGFPRLLTGRQHRPRHAQWPRPRPRPPRGGLSGGGGARRAERRSAAALGGMTAATAGAERLRDGSCHFQRSRLIWMIAITFGMILLGWVTLWPSTIPYSYLGIFGTFLNYLVENHHKWVCYGFWVSWLIHVVEAFYGVKLCQSKGITDPAIQFQWFIQTLLFGYASFGLLVSYKPSAKKH